MQRQTHNVAHVSMQRQTHNAAHVSMHRQTHNTAHVYIHRQYTQRGTCEQAQTHNTAHVSTHRQTHNTAHVYTHRLYTQSSTCEHAQTHNVAHVCTHRQYTQLITVNETKWRPGTQRAHLQLAELVLAKLQWESCDGTGKGPTPHRLTACESQPAERSSPLF